ncbi:MAG TPA: YXWGXW repeat-containing protein [Steroidobacteraceae bacterium]
MTRNQFILAALALALALLLASPAAPAMVSVGVSINVAPPVLPVYEQPPIPGDGYIWTPGYWAWADEGYYWVPGTWVEAPQPGYLWTPGYWGFADGIYAWHAGYWGPHIGFYGGVNYGFGYTGVGYAGGYWDHDHFRYNSAYNNVHDVHITNVYNKTVIVNNNHVSFNGGNGGIQARPTAGELAAEHDHHFEPVAAQIQQRDGARGQPQLRASANHGRPPIAATARAGGFSGEGVMAAHGAGPSAPGAGTPHANTFNGAPAHAPTAPHPTPQQHEHAHGGPPQGGQPHHAGGGGNGGGHEAPHESGHEGHEHPQG